MRDQQGDERRQFTVLFVCTGNICRSPMAEQLFRARTDQTLVPILTASAGTSGLTGWGMDGPSALVLRELGGNASGHYAQRLSRGLIADADLILTAETKHRAASIRADSGAAGRAFTLREFGRTGAGLGLLPEPATAAALCTRVGQIAERRDTDPSAEPMLDDIGDPYGASPELVRGCGRQIASAVDAVIDALGIRRVVAAAMDAPA